jgi:hypothetical protein
MKITLFKILQTLIAMKVYQCKDKILKINIEVQVMCVIDLTRYFFKSQYYLYFFLSEEQVNITLLVFRTQ